MVDFSTKEYATLAKLLSNGEKPVLEVVEDKVAGFRPFFPVRIYATDKRIIIIKRRILGTDTIKLLRYDHITETVFKKGLFSSKIHFNLIGEQYTGSSGKKWLKGLAYNDALDLVNLVHSIQDKNQSWVPS